VIGPHYQWRSQASGPIAECARRTSPWCAAVDPAGTTCSRSAA